MHVNREATVMPLGNLEGIEQDFAEAALDNALWVKALERVAIATNSFGAVLLPVTGRIISAVPFTENLTPSFETYIRDDWYHRDERHRGISIMRTKGAVDDLDMFSPDEINKHAYYQEFLAPHRLRWFGGVGIKCDKDFWCLSIQRTIDQEPFSTSEKNQLAKLSKSLSGTAAIASAIGGATAAGALDAFEISGRGAALVNRDGKIFKINKVAEQLLNGDIRITKGRLVAVDSEAGIALERALNELINRPSSAALRPPIAFARRGRYPLLAYPTRLSSMTRNVLSDCQALVIFVDTEAGSRPSESALQMVFHLSDAEARLAARVASGEALETSAERLGIAKETSRSQLKSIFAKTGCHRHSELVAVLSNFLKGERTNE
jgi:DNA-binding CsgD family transcriptional regulator